MVNLFVDFTALHGLLSLCWLLRQARRSQNGTDGTGTSAWAVPAHHGHWLMIHEASAKIGHGEYGAAQVCICISDHIAKAFSGGPMATDYSETVRAKPWNSAQYR
jgi:hypothetical protein